MSYAVDILPDALEDLEGIHTFIFEREGLAVADKLSEGIDKVILGLVELPRRGHVPPELVDMGSRNVLEVHFKPYRIIYEVRERRVLVIVIADGRRDFRALLANRMLR